MKKPRSGLQVQLVNLTLRYIYIRGVLARRCVEVIVALYRENFQWDSTVMEVPRRCITFVVKTRVDCIQCNYRPCTACIY
jgi:hypothetical protein